MYQELNHGWQHLSLKVERGKERATGSPPYRNEAMAPLYVATLTVQIELPKYEIIFSI